MSRYPPPGTCPCIWVITKEEEPHTLIDVFPF